MFSPPKVCACGYLNHCDQCLNKKQKKPTKDIEINDDDDGKCLENLLNWKKNLKDILKEE